MILHKENTLRIEPFLNSVNDLSLYDNEAKPEIGLNELKLLEKYSYFIQKLMSFEQDIKGDNNIKILLARFLAYLKGIIPVKGLSLLFFDEFKRELLPVDNEDESPIIKTMNHFYKEGIFRVLFNEKKTLIIPDLDSYNSEGSKLFYLIFPVYDKDKDYGILSILTSISKENITEIEKKTINIFLNLLLGKLEKLKLSEKLNDTYEELQTYQAKLSNDFRLSAIGEMTQGIVEDIVNPLQVISSNVDLLNNDNESKLELIQIKSQVKKIKNVIGRLVKFADVNQKDVKIQPCNLNSIINDYFYLVKSTLENANLEYILDFENDLPPLLSHPNYIYQLLTNIFSLIKGKSVKKGGVIIQTRYKEDRILLRVISTNKVDVSKKNENDVQQNLSLSILKNLMKKHEGEIEIGSYENSGAAIVLNFPLKRKIRK